MIANHNGIEFNRRLYAADDVLLSNHNSSNLMSTIYNDNVEPVVDPNEVRCFGVYGCYSVQGPWMIENRPQAQ